MGRGLWHQVKKHSLQVVTGTLPYPDPNADSDTQLKTALETVRPGAIIILHDGDDHNPDSDRPRGTVEMLPRLIDELKKDGYKIAPLKELLYGERC